MFRCYVLQPITVHDQPLIFEWDPETGELRGEGATIVNKMCDEAVRSDCVLGHPYPTVFEVSDPLHRVTEMAVVIGQYWRLEGDLLKAYPWPRRRLSVPNTLDG